MALTAHPPAPAWGARWPQHHPNNDYVLDANMMPYESRPNTSATMQRTVLPQYYSAPFSAAPMATITAPHYHQPAASYAGYPYTPSHTLGSPFKQQQQYSERPQPRISVEPEQNRGFQEATDIRLSSEGSRSPSVKSESQMSSTRSVASSGRRSSRVITSNLPVGGNHIDFNTGVDTLMKAIQAKREAEELLKKAEAGGTPQPQPADIKVEQQRSPLPDSQQVDSKQQDRKRFFCEIPGCNKSFTQKTHLDIHLRAHTGEQPYTCKLEGCGQRFSQLGNLKTHERRHTGEKPYHCEQCGKSFAQRGNVRAHMKTHSQTKPFLCRLDDCNKTFTQLGNLKSHQNKFHLDTLKTLTARVASTGFDTLLSEDKDFWEYFTTMYKNSNKGIKGRGKDRKVGPVPRISSISPISPTSTMGHFPLPNGMPQLLHHAPPTHTIQHQLPFHGLSHPAAYSMSRPSLMLQVGRDSHNSYDMYDADVASIASSGPTSASSGPIYDDDHRRDLAFGDRSFEGHLY
ncbi:hypothetical protein B0H67DRAFT_487052 [Lasiosphaeris hirsuta]|uniref:C2H2 type master regulator of conidiophore development brlA n=1 Tax=Lasiosphaeris hirsuta TaxID=260670 RepID=A0AA40ARX5_9PEZI|nr:hypothetical protein B0H67DRAFT_487052 [Lasiosphaeris hirsuta]